VGDALFILFFSTAGFFLVLAVSPTDIQYTLVPREPEAPECVTRFIRHTEQWRQEYDKQRFEADFTNPQAIIFRLRSPVWGGLYIRPPEPLTDLASGCGVYNVSKVATPGGTMKTPFGIALIALFPALSLLVIPLYRFRKKQVNFMWSLRDWLPASRVSALLAVAFGLFLYSLEHLLQIWVAPPTDALWPRLVAFIHQSGPLSLGIFILLFTVLFPVAEELFFRGYWFMELRSRYGWKAGGWVISILFGSLHFSWMAGAHPAWQVYAFLATTALSWVAIALYMRFRNILAPIVFHMVYNAIALYLPK
jgi:membrane protease YdiL (CAAX protease family)